MNALEETAQAVYQEFKERDWPNGGNDAELQTFIMNYTF